MSRVKRGDYVEWCMDREHMRTRSCDLGEPAHHLYGVAAEDEVEGALTLAVLVPGDPATEVKAPTCRIVAYAWSGWVPDELDEDAFVDELYRRGLWREWDDLDPCGEVYP